MKVHSIILQYVIVWHILQVGPSCSCVQLQAWSSHQVFLKSSRGQIPLCTCVSSSAFLFRTLLHPLSVSVSCMTLLCWSLDGSFWVFSGSAGQLNLQVWGLPCFKTFDSDAGKQREQCLCDVRFQRNRDTAVGSWKKRWWHWGLLAALVRRFISPGVDFPFGPCFQEVDYEKALSVLFSLFPCEGFRCLIVWQQLS